MLPVAGKVHEKALKLHAIASLNVISTPSNENHNDVNTQNQNDFKNGTIPAISNGQVTDPPANGSAANHNEENGPPPVRSPSANTEGSAVGSDDCITTRDVVVTNEGDIDDTASSVGNRSQVWVAIFTYIS